MVVGAPIFHTFYLFLMKQRRGLCHSCLTKRVDLDPEPPRICRSQEARRRVLRYQCDSRVLPKTIDLPRLLGVKWLEPGDAVGSVGIDLQIGEVSVIPPTTRIAGTQSTLSNVLTVDAPVSPASYRSAARVRHCNKKPQVPAEAYAHSRAFQSKGDLPMNIVKFPDTSPRLEDLVEKAKEIAAAVEARATLKAYRNDWRDFESWCRGRRLNALSPIPETVPSTLQIERHRWRSERLSIPVSLPLWAAQRSVVRFQHQRFGSCPHGNLPVPKSWAKLSDFRRNCGLEYVYSWQRTSEPHPTGTVLLTATTALSLRSTCSYILTR